MLQQDGLGRNFVLFHICEAPQHGREFNNYKDSDGDSYPDGPLKPIGSAVSPPFRTKPWKDEVEEVLLKLKNKLNVSK